MEIGQVRKCHGYGGEIKLIVHEGHEDDISAVDFLFIGATPSTALPYEVTGLRGADWICSLEGVGTKEAAAELRGRSIFLRRGQVTETPVVQVRDAAQEYRRFLGFALVDTELGEVGQIVGLNDSSLQTLARVSRGEKEVLIPLTNDLIRGVDFVKKIVFMALPEGLLEL